MSAGPDAPLRTASGGSSPALALEITLQRRAGAGWPVVVERSQAASAGDSGLRLPVRQEGRLELDAETLLKLGDPLEYGSALGQALFKEQVYAGFIAALSAARAANSLLRVLLFVEADDLKPLRWERLAAPLDGGWDFLALHQQTPFSLYLPSLTDRRFPPFGRRDLRALALVAAPHNLNDYDLAPFDAAATGAALRAAFGQAGGDGADAPSGVPVDFLGIEGTPPASLEALTEALTAHHYTLLHIVAHGRLDRSGETALYLSNSEGQVKAVTAAQLIRRLAQLGGGAPLPHLTFLSTCDSASPQAEAALGGLGQRLVRELGMPAVVAMTGPVSIPTAEALAGAFYRRLRAHAYPDLALAEATSGLAGRYDINVPVIFNRLGAQPLFSDTPDRPLTPAELAYGLERAAALLNERAPVLLPEFERLQPALAPLAAGTGEAGLSPAAQAEAETALARLNALTGEALDLAFPALALGQEPPPYDARCPFRGLYPFRVEDHAFFFGREALVERMLRRLDEHPFLALLGPSGCGKSSLALAGMVSTLQGKDPTLRLAYLTPGDHPLARLQTALDETQPAAARIFVVDQFEELFTLARDPAERQEFIARVLALAETSRVILTMRADFWGEVAAFPALRAAMQARQELIAPMDAAELRSAMEQQAAAAGLRFEGGLGAAILEQVQGEPGAMPLLQHALLLLWQRRRGRWLRLEEYQRSGGLKQAIAATADEVYQDLSRLEKEQARDIFIRLTRTEDAPAGEAATAETRLTRQRVALAELTPAGGDPADTRKLVERLAGARLIVTTGGTDGSEVEVAHEALIRHWPRLRSWLEEDGDLLHRRAAVREAALDWDARQRDESLLVHRAARLDNALELLEARSRYRLNELESAYVKACAALRQRERAEKEAIQRRELEAAQKLAEEERLRREQAVQHAGRLRQRAVLLAVVAGIAAVLAFVSIALFRVSENNAAEARRQEATAVYNARAAQTNAAAAADAQADAERQRATAVAAGQEALNQQAIAELNAAEAGRQATISLSRQLAAQSLAALRANQVDLALLLAAQAQQITDTVQSRGALLIGLQSQPALERILTGHADYVIALAYSPDGARLASVGCHRWDRLRQKCILGELRLWDTATGVVRNLLTEDATLLSAAAFSPDGRYLVTGDLQGGITLRDPDNGNPVGGSIRAHEGRISRLQFSPDGRTLYTASGSEPARAWELNAAGQVPVSATLVLDPQRQSGLTISPSGRLAAFMIRSAGTEPAGESAPEEDEQSSPGSAIVIWDLQAGQRQAVLALPGDTQGVGSLLFAPDEQSLVMAAGFAVLAYDLARPGESPRKLAEHDDLVLDLAFSPQAAADPLYLASAGRDRVVRLTPWISPTGETSPPAILLTGHSDFITSLAFSPDGRFLASGSRDKTIRLWEWRKAPTLGIVLGGAPALTISPDGKLAAQARCRTQDPASRDCLEGEIRLIDPVTRQPVGSPLIGHTDLINNLQFSPDGQTLASGSRDETVILWDVAGRVPRFPPLTGHGDFITGLDFTADGGRLVSSSRDGSLIIWEVSTGRPLGVPLRGHTVRDGFNRVLCVAFSPNGGLVVSGGIDSRVVLWDLRSTPPLSWTLLGHTNQLNSVVFSTDGRQVASADSDGRLLLWDLRLTEDGAPTTPVSKTLEGHTQRITSLALSPDGRILASAGWDEQILLWELPSGTLVGEALKGHTDRIGGMAFLPPGLQLLPGGGSPGDAVLVSVDAGNQALLWELDVRRWLEQACSVAARTLTRVEWEQYLPGLPFAPACRAGGSP